MLKDIYRRAFGGKQGVFHPGTKDADFTAIGNCDRGCPVRWGSRGRNGWRTSGGMAHDQIRPTRAVAYHECRPILREHRRGSAEAEEQGCESTKVDMLPAVNDGDSGPAERPIPVSSILPTGKCAWFSLHQSPLGDFYAGESNPQIPAGLT